MKFNLDILIDCFDNTASLVRSIDNNRYDLIIRRMRLCPTETRQNSHDPDLERQILTVYDAKVLLELTSLTNTGPLAIACADSDVLASVQKWLEQHAPDNPAAAVVIEGNSQALLDVLEQRACELDAWDERLVDAVLRRASFSEILEVGAEMLDNPIALFDSATSLIAYAGYLPDSYKETVWKDVLERGYTPMTFFEKDERKRMRVLGAAYDMLMFKPRREHGRTQFSAFLRLKNGMPLGSLGQVDLVAPITPGQVALVLHLRNRLVERYALEPCLEHQDAELERYVRLMLLGADYPHNALEHQLELHGWTSRERYRLLLFPSYSDHHPKDFNPEMLQYRNHLTTTFPEGLIVDLNGQFVMIMRELDYESVLTRLSNMLFSAFAPDYRICGASDVLESFSDLRIGFTQAQIALDETMNSGVSGAISFSDVFESHVAKILRANNSPETYFHPAILKLMHGDEPRLESLRYIYTYLLSGCNVSKAAKRLYMHRNTLVYRLERLEKELDLIMAELDSHEAFRLVTSCMLALETNNSSA